LQQNCNLMWLLNVCPRYPRRDSPGQQCMNSNGSQVDGETGTPAVLIPCLLLFQVVSVHEGKTFLFLKFIYFNWRLITLQYCGGFCHTFTWIIHGCTCVPYPEQYIQVMNELTLWIKPVKINSHLNGRLGFELFTYLFIQ